MSKFNILYSGDQVIDALTLCDYIDEFYANTDLTVCDLSVPKILGVLQATHQDFPSPLGVANASPFKKVAAFTANFAAEKPIYSPLLPHDFGELSTHQNAIIAVSLSIDALEGAVLKCKDRGEVVLNNRITLSKHYWKDFIAAVSDTLPSHHFDCLSLIYEALAYQANPEASYARVI